MRGEIDEIKIALGFSVAAMIVFTIRSSYTPELELTAGKATFFALLLSAVLWFTSLRKSTLPQRAQTLFVIFSLLLVAGLAAGFSKNAYYDYQYSMMRKGIAEAVSDYRAGKAIGLEPLSWGDPGELEKVTRLSLKRDADFKARYEAEILKSGVADILSPQNLAADEDLVDTKLAIESAESIVQRFAADSRKQFEILENELSTLNISNSSKKAFLKGHYDTKSSKIKSNEYYWKLEISIIEHYKKIVTFLEKYKGSWSIKNKNIMFSDEEIYRKYSELIKELNSIYKEQDDLIKNEAILFEYRARNFVG